MMKRSVAAMASVVFLGGLAGAGTAQEAAAPAVDGSHAGDRAAPGVSQPAPARPMNRPGRAWWAPVADRGWLGIRLSAKAQVEQALAAEKLADEWLQVPNLDWLSEGWDGKGALVLQVFPDSPAEKAGLLPGDVILSFNGIRTSSAGELVFVVQRAIRGHDGEMDVLRDDETRMVLVEVGLHPEDARRMEEEAEAKRREGEPVAPSTGAAAPAPAAHP